MSIRFASPLSLYLPAAVALVLAIAFALDFHRRRRLLDKIGDPGQLTRMMASLSTRARVIKAVLLATAMTMIAIAITRPEVEGESTWSKRGIDVVVAMDFSKSMMARDVYPSRLEHMVKEVDDLLDLLDLDRVAVVTFSGAAAHFPLTHDYEAVRNLYRGLSPQDMPPGSDLGEAIMVARCIVRPDLLEDPGCERVGGRGRGGAPLDGSDEDKELATEPEIAERARAIVLLTDGEDTESRARAEVERAVLLGIHVYVVGIGTIAGELIPELDDDGNEVGWKKTEDGKSFITTRLDQAGLKELAEIAGGEGHYFDGARAADLAEVLKRLKRGDLDSRVKKEWKADYQWVLLIGFLLLVIEACISGRRRRMLYPEEQP